MTAALVEEDVPLISYTEEEHQTWRTIMQTLAPLIAEHGCSSYHRAARRLWSPQDLDRIPQQQDVSERLAALTGFRIVPTRELVPPAEFFGALARRTFPATAFVRDGRMPFFAANPDWVHELVGHVTALGSRRMACLYHLFGQAAAASADPESLRRISTLYWYSAETGVIREGNRWRAVGAALLSSVTELRNFTDSNIQPFDCAVIEDQVVDDSQPQSIFFAASSFRALVDTVSQRLERFISAAADPGGPGARRA